MVWKRNIKKYFWQNNDNLIMVSSFIYIAFRRIKDLLTCIVISWREGFPRHEVSDDKKFVRKLDSRCLRHFHSIMAKIQLDRNFPVIKKRKKMVGCVWNTCSIIVYGKERKKLIQVVCKVALWGVFNEVRAFVDQKNAQKDVFKIGCQKSHPMGGKRVLENRFLWRRKWDKEEIQKGGRHSEWQAEKILLFQNLCVSPRAPPSFSVSLPLLFPSLSHFLLSPLRKKNIFELLLAYENF